MESKASAPAGSLLCIDAGEYSDYGVVGFFVVLREFTPATELDAFLSENEEQRGRFKSPAFVAHLIRKGLLLEIEYGSLWLSDYGRYDDCTFRPAGDIL